jgi:hypothetical protein
LIARTARDPLATPAPAERDLVNARPRQSNSSYQFKSICRWADATRRPALPDPPEVQVVGERALAVERAAAGSQACTRSSPAPRPQPLRRLRRRTRSFRRTWARCGASSLREGPGQHSWRAGGRACGRPCMRRALSSSAQLVHAGRRPPCVRRLAPCMHSRTPCEHAVQRRGRVPLQQTRPL